MNKLIALLMGIFMVGASAASAQKFGFCNSNALLAELPEVKQADSELQDFQKILTKKGQEMVKELQDQAAELERKKEQGTISPKDYETQAAKLQEDEGKIRQYEQEVYTKLSQKREQLYKPLLERVNNAMKDVATENNFAYVFDSSTEVLLYADPTLDVTPLVKKKLGI